MLEYFMSFNERKMRLRNFIIIISRAYLVEDIAFIIDNITLPDIETVLDVE